MMRVTDLERERLIARLPVDRRKVKDALNLARRDLRVARKILPENRDWAFSIAYNSMLQAGRSLMFSKGYRPVGDARHVSVIRFVETCLGRDFRRVVIAFDRMRRKRHAAVYGAAGAISEVEARNAVERAGSFLSEIKKILAKDGFI